MSKRRVGGNTEQVHQLVPNTRSYLHGIVVLQAPMSQTTSPVGPTQSVSATIISAYAEASGTPGHHSYGGRLGKPNFDR